MGVPLVPEAGGRHWAPVLLALFLAASRGKAAGVGGEAHRDNTAGEGAAGGQGAPSACPVSYLLGPRCRGQRVPAKCPGWAAARLHALTAAQAAAGLTLPCPESPAREQLLQRGDGHGLVAAFRVATPYSLYVCSEGQNVTLTCRIMGPMAKGHDVTYYKTWYRSSRGEVQVCSERRPIRNLTFQDLHLHHSGHQANTSQDLAQRYGLESVSDHHGNFSITMRNLTPMDSGLYCCLVVEIRHHHSEQRVHGAMELQVQTDKAASARCIAYPPSPRESESITAAALATGACIVGILCLPLILLLVYKQRQVASNRRAQELVRMDSNNTQGVENPGFEVSLSSQGMPEAKPRSPLSYMAQRQPSESGRHLLSEPCTPLSPPGPGDVFFPTLDPVPDSPNSEAI
ncbi:hypothetical protein GH733_000847 [Mirounga leonina]|nr:hypothetical protein GH733_000847 [Mirounga leonina]